MTKTVGIGGRQRRSGIGIHHDRSEWRTVALPLLLMVVVVVLVWLPFRQTVTGRTVYAVGSSEAASFMSGLAIDRARLPPWR